MDNEKNEWSEDWQHYDWATVERELAERTPEDKEIPSLPKEMFLEYLRWMGENTPELLELADKMLKVEREGGSIEELEKLKKEWNEFTGND